MLDGMRANAQSWGVKVAFGIIIVVFVFWGIGSFTGSSGVVASVDGENITEMEFRRTMAQMEENIRRFMPDATPDMIRSLRLEQQALQTLVVQKLLEREAERLGVSISPWELRREVERLPYFLNSEGVFDKDRYLAAFEGSGRTVAQFEKSMRADMLPAKMTALLSAGAWADPGAVRNMYEFQQEKRVADYVFFPSAPHMEAAAPAESDIVQAYKDREPLYAMPARVRLEYVNVNPTDLGDTSSITDEAVAAAYEERRGQFTVPERMHARHILISVAEKAPQEEVDKAEARIRELADRVKGGEDFAAVAAECSQDPGSAASGGDLGWFAREQMVPAFAEAAFSLQPGEMSGPVRSPFGFHLIRVEERQDAATRSLDEVRGELRVALAAEAAEAVLQDTADAALASAMAGKSMAEVADQAGLELMDTGLVSAEQLAEKLGLKAADVQTFMNTPAGTVMDTAMPLADGLLVIRVAESLPAMTRPLKEVRDEIADSLAREKARDMAVADARTARTNFVEGQPDEALREQVKRSESFGRDGMVPDLGYSPSLADAVFSASEVGEATPWLDNVYPVDEGAVLARPVQILLPEEAFWQAVSEPLLNDMRQNRARMLFSTYLEQLVAKADVRILTPSLFPQENASR